MSCAGIQEPFIRGSCHQLFAPLSFLLPTYSSEHGCEDWSSILVLEEKVSLGTVKWKAARSLGPWGLCRAIAMPALDCSPLHFYSWKKWIFTIFKLLFQRKQFYYSQPNIILSNIWTVTVQSSVNTLKFKLINQLWCVKICYKVQVREGLIISEVSWLCLSFKARVQCLHMVFLLSVQVPSAFQPTDFALVSAPVPGEPKLWHILLHLASIWLPRPAPSPTARRELGNQTRGRND